MTQSQDIAEKVFWKAGNEEQKENKKNSLVVQQVVIALHGLFPYELFYKWTTKPS